MVEHTEEEKRKIINEVLREKPESPLKKCNKCLKKYPNTPEFFHRHIRRKDGLNRVCKNCRKI